MTGGEPSYDAYRKRGDDRGGVCNRCNSIIKPPESSSGSTGYGIIDLGDGPVKVCYPCCATLDKEYMHKHGRITLYVHINIDSSKPIESNIVHVSVVNWPHSLILQCFKWKKGKHNIGGERLDVWFEFGGRIWWGVHYGFNNEIVYCKRTQQPKRSLDEAAEAICATK
jgi:hypothetical protein